jgi:hypothetical protein
MSRRGSSVEELQENRKNLKGANFLENFLNKAKGSGEESLLNKLYDGVSFKDFLPATLRINYDITQGQFPYQEEFTSMFSFLNKGKKDEKDEKEDERNYLEENKQLLGEIADLSEKARDKAALRTGISNLALSPLIGSQAAMDAAAEINRMTIANMGAMAAQNRVLESNPTKQKIAGKYFR